MKGAEFRAIRERLGLNEAEFASELGYTGKGKNRVKVIGDFEADRKRIPLYIARLAWLIDKVVESYAKTDGQAFYHDWRHINWPDWPGYTREELEDG